MTFSRVAFVCLFPMLALLAGCTDQPDPEAETPDTEPPVETPGPTPSFEATKIDTIYVEGEPQPVTLTLLDAPDLPFITYFPTDEFIPEVTRSPRGHGVRLYANFGGVENRDVYAAFFVSGGETPADSVADLKAFLTSTFTERGWQQTADTASCGNWSTDHLTFRDPTTDPASSGYACFGAHDGLPLYLLTHTLPEYGDGFGPLLQTLLDEFRWRDTGNGL